MNKLYFLLAIFFTTVIVSCNSVKKYNETVNSEHSVAELHKDIDFTFKKIKRLHPNLYWFISKEKLDFKIDSVKNSITKPLTSKEFYFILYPLVSEIRQGHNYVSYPGDRYEKEMAEKYKKTTNKFNLLNFENVEGKIIINEIYDSIKTLKNAELLKIDNFEIKDLMTKYNTLRSSDGFNTTFIERRKGMMLKSYYRIENPTLDSVTLKLSLNDSIFDTTFYRVKKPIKKKDSLKEKELAKLSDEEKSTIKKDKEKEVIYNKIRGYNKKTKTYTRDYKFLEDSTVGYIKIKGFRDGPYRDLYEEFFFKVDSIKPKSVVVDLRDNVGGRVNEIHELLGYFYTEQYRTKMDLETNIRTPKTNGSWSKNNDLLSVIFKSIITPFIWTSEMIKSKKKNGKIYYKTKACKPTAPKGLAYEGKVYVLVNGNSFSAASGFSTHLQGSKRATIVGEETGGAYNGTVAGVIKQIKLPNSKLKVHFGLVMSKTEYNESPDGYGVIPDHIILPTIENRKQGVDAELEFILKQIKETKAKDLIKVIEVDSEESEILDGPIQDKTDREDKTIKK